MLHEYYNRNPITFASLIYLQKNQKHDQNTRSIFLGTNTKILHFFYMLVRTNGIPAFVDLVALDTTPLPCHTVTVIQIAVLFRPIFSQAKGK